MPIPLIPYALPQNKIDPKEVVASKIIEPKCSKFLNPHSPTSLAGSNACLVFIWDTEKEKPFLQPHCVVEYGR